MDTLKSKVQNNSDEFLNQMRMTGDKLADETIHAIVSVSDGSDYANVFKTLQSLAKNEPSMSAEVQQKFNDFYAVSAEIPCSPSEYALLDKAAQIFDDHGFKIVTLLFFKALPLGYMCPFPAHVLHRTHLLEQKPARRVLETGQFIFDVCRKGWYNPGSVAIRSIQHLRLVHAYVRYSVLNDNTNPWNAELGDTNVKQGIPINQEDLLLTLQLFSIETLSGLELMGTKLTDEEEDAFFFHWRIVGLMLGIQADLMPNNRTDARTIQKKIYSRLISVENPYGKDLTEALLGIIHNSIPERMQIDKLDYFVGYFVADPRVFKSLKLHTPTWKGALMGLTVIAILRANELESVDYKAPGLKWYQRIWYFIVYSIKKVQNFFQNTTDKVKTENLEKICKLILTGMTAKDEKSGKPALKVDEALQQKWQLAGEPIKDTEKEVQNAAESGVSAESKNENEPEQN